MRSTDATNAAALALIFACVCATPSFGANVWFAGGGAEAPRFGSSGFGKLNDRGPSFVLGLEHPVGGTTGILVRAGYSQLPPNDAAASRYGYAELGNTTLVTLMGGLRFRRQDLAFSPYFDLGVGVGLVDVHQVFATDLSGSSQDGAYVGWATTWGAGIAWHGDTRYGFFLDGHWDTVPGGHSEQVWTAAVRAGMEWR